MVWRGRSAMGTRCPRSMITTQGCGRMEHKARTSLLESRFETQERGPQSPRAPCAAGFNLFAPSKGRHVPRTRGPRRRARPRAHRVLRGARVQAGRRRAPYDRAGRRARAAAGRRRRLRPRHPRRGGNARAGRPDRARPQGDRIRRVHPRGGQPVVIRVTSDRLALLQSFGLTENQSRVYLALLEYPSVGAGELAKSAGVARNRLYEVLEELNAMGLTQIILEEPRKYRARDLDAYVERRVESLAAHLHEIEARRANLAAFRPRPLAVNATDDAGTTQVLLGRGVVAEQ